MGAHTRRTFVGAVGAVAIPGLGSKLQFRTHDQEFPPPRLINPNGGDWVGERPSRTAANAIAFDLENDEILVHRLWEPDSGQTLSAERISSDEVSPQQLDFAEGTDTISMLYRENGDGELSYMFDLGPSNNTRVRVRDDPRAGNSENHARSFDEHGVTITTQIDRDIEASLTVEIPYSLYMGSRIHNPGRRFSLLPVPGENGFEAYAHAPLVELLDELFEAYPQRASKSLPPYQEVSIVAEFVQSIPHATDWKSARKISFIRTPEETLVELTADCKDASLLMYHLLDSLGYHPVLVYLVGDLAPESLDVVTDGRGTDGKAASEKGDDEIAAVEKKDDADEKVQYPNHLAVGVPRTELEPLPRAIAADAAIFEHHDGAEYVYVESTSGDPPGLISDERRRMRAVLYEERHEFAAGLIPFL